MLKELSEAGVVFDLCVINILDEAAGVRRQFGTTRDGRSGQTEHPLSDVSDDFMLIFREEQPVLREVDDAVAAACEATRQLFLTCPLFQPGELDDSLHRSDANICSWPKAARHLNAFWRD